MSFTPQAKHWVTSLVAVGLSWIGLGNPTGAEPVASPAEDHRVSFESSAQFPFQPLAQRNNIDETSNPDQIKVEKGKVTADARIYDKSVQ